MQDRQTTPDFKEDRVFDKNLIFDTSDELREEVLCLLDDIITDIDNEISDYDRELMKSDIINHLKKKL